MMNKKRLGALVLAGTMMFGMSANVFAAPPTDVNSNGTVPLQKDFEMAAGLTTPDVTFQFEATSITPDAPTATITPISYQSTEKGTDADADGKYVISKNATISFGAWKHAGEYVYTVKETPGTADTGITYSDAEYTLRVYVINEGDGLKVQQITAEGKGEKTDKILFTNTYKKKDASLTIEKKTEGNYVDKTKQFDFTVQFTKSATEDTLANFTGTLTRKGGTSEQVTCSNGTATFKLADGDALVFNNLPVGTTYVVTETGVSNDGYTPTVNVIENDVDTVKNVIGTEANDLSSSNQGKNNLVGEKTNKVTFVNNYKDIAITGVFMNNLPFILLVGIAIVAFGSLALLKKHRRIEK